MPNNTINISFDWLKIQGSSLVKNKAGDDCVLIVIKDSRAKPFQRQDGSRSIFGELDIKANRDGEDKFKKTHFVTEASTKEERSNKVKMPIIGNGKEFVFDGGKTRQPSQHGAVPAKDHPLMDEGSDTIPF